MHKVVGLRCPSDNHKKVKFSTGALSDPLYSRAVLLAVHNISKFSEVEIPLISLAGNVYAEAPVKPGWTLFLIQCETIRRLPTCVYGANFDSRSGQYVCRHAYKQIHEIADIRLL